MSGVIDFPSCDDGWTSSLPFCYLGGPVWETLTRVPRLLETDWWAHLS
jgi:hypothetical protein